MAQSFFRRIRAWGKSGGAALAHAVAAPQVHELLRWCLPALILGCAARIALTVHFPYGYVQADTADFLVTTQRFFVEKTLVLHGKKTFLGPILFALPFFIKIPALLIVPLAQHLLGLVLTVMSGALVRRWFRHWKWFIIPATVLITLNPALLWYEHALLAESHYLFCAVALALAGSIFVAERTRKSFVWLLVTMFFTAGSRPEGKLFILFVLAVVALVYWGQWRQWVEKVGIAGLACTLIWLCTRNHQAGLLLYATVLPLAPDVSRVAPDFSPWINPLRDTYRSQGETVRTELTTAEKTIWNIATQYYQAKGEQGDPGAFCQKLAVEAACHRPLTLPLIAANKFLQSLSGSTSGGFTGYWVLEKQYKSYLRKKWMLQIMKGLTGRELHHPGEVIAFINQAYRPLHPDWFAALQRAWNSLTLHARVTPDRHYPTAKIPGAPLFFVLAGLGMLVAMLRRGALQVFHIPWVLALGGVWVAVLLTGVVNARYRFVFEPFCVLYALLFFDAAASGVAACLNRGRTKAPQPAPAASVG